MQSVAGIPGVPADEQGPRSALQRSRAALAAAVAHMCLAVLSILSWVRACSVPQSALLTGAPAARPDAEHGAEEVAGHANMLHCKHYAPTKYNMRTNDQSTSRVSCIDVPACMAEVQQEGRRRVAGGNMDSQQPREQRAL
jgi:hypothetical protein